MKKNLFCRGVFASFFAFLVMAASVMAADMRTVAVISAADLDTGVKVLKSLTTEAGYPDAMAGAEMMLPMLEGFDTKQPVGIVILADDESFAGYAFLPIADVSTMPMLEDFVDMGEKQPDGSILVPTGHPFVPAIYVKQSGKWAFLSLNELPKDLPTDPAKLLEGMDKKYVLGVKINVANLPKDLCMGILAGVRMMAEMGASTEEQLEGISAGFEQIEMALEQLKALTFGIEVSEDNDVIIETNLEAVAGTVMAADIQSMANFKTTQIGFYQPEDSVAAVLGTGVLNAVVKRQYIDQLSTFFEGAREGLSDGDLAGDEEIAAAESVLDNLEAMLLSTVESGKIDIGFTWKANGTVLVGAAIEGGDKLLEAFEQSVVAIPEEFQPYLSLNDSELEGYSISTIVVSLGDLPLPDADDIPEQIMNKTITAQIGVKDKAVAFAIGWNDDVKADFAKAVSASKTPAAVPKEYLVFTPYYMVTLLKDILPPPEDEPEAVEMLEALVACGPEGRITSEMTFSGNSQNERMIISHKLLPGIGQLIGISIEAAQNARQQMFDGGFYDDDDFDIEEFDF